jgi:hypothetical protein
MTGSDGSSNSDKELLSVPCSAAIELSMKLLSASWFETTSETESTFYKIKRILAQRKRDKPEYLVQFMGEPAQNAVWTTFDQLNPQAQK